LKKQKQRLLKNLRIKNVDIVAETEELKVEAAEKLEEVKIATEEEASELKADATEKLDEVKEAFNEKSRN